MSAPDFRALCVELASLLSKTQSNSYKQPFEVDSLQGQIDKCLKRCLVALAAEPQGPTDEELTSASAEILSIANELDTQP